MGIIKIFLIIVSIYALYKYVSETYADYVPKKDLSLVKVDDTLTEETEETNKENYIDDEGKSKKKKGKPGEICFSTLCISKDQLKKEYDVLTNEEKKELIAMLSKEE